MELKDLQEQLAALKKENAKLIKSNNEVITKLNEKEAKDEKNVKLEAMRKLYVSEGGNADLWDDYLKVNELQLLKGELNKDTKWAFTKSTKIAEKVNSDLKEPEPEKELKPEAQKWQGTTLNKLL